MPQFYKHGSRVAMLSNAMHQMQFISPAKQAISPSPAMPDH